jgi:hypothetical protein
MKLLQTARNLLLTAFLFATPTFAGPPLLCDPFDTAGAPSLDWGDGGWNDALRDYDLEQLVAHTEALLTPDTPVIARMETLRRAAIYASRRGVIARQLDAALDARIATASTDDAKALALLDAGYFLETVQEISRLQGYDMPGIGRVDAEALRELLARPDGSERIDAALALRPDDAALHFAAALVASADQRGNDRTDHARQARAFASRDRLLALNLDRVSY